MGDNFMIEFAWPYLFLLLPIPLIILKWFSARQSHAHAALKVPEINDFIHLQSQSPTALPQLKTLFTFFIWIALVTAAARPQWIGKAIEIPQSGRDLMLAVDLSGSMQIKDFESNGQKVDRLTVSKMVAGDFIDRRKGDRIGLILFGTQAYLQTPLTFDTSTVKELLKEAEIGLAGKDTAIGDAIGMAVKQLRDSPQTSRVLILLTDGVNNAGELSPEKAAEIASHEHLKVHTIGLGSKSMVVNTMFGARQVNPSAEIDEKALKLVADKTGGKYFRAYNTQELAQIYQEIDQLESIERKNHFYRPTEEIYFWPLLIAIICIGMLMGFEAIRRYV